MLDNKGFDAWSKSYDQAVNSSDAADQYPFAGYQSVMDEIFQLVCEKAEAKVLDIGFGTATLSSRLYQKGCEIYGQDFSQKMLDLASEKMPGAHLYQGDFSQGLVEPLKQEKYDFIIASYSLHHLNHDEQIVFITELLNLLKEGGSILIGDVTFAQQSQLEACKELAGDEWDSEEYYFIVDDLITHFPDLIFKPKSYCGGLIIINRPA